MPKPSLQRGSVPLSMRSEPGDVTGQQPAPNCCCLPSRHLLPGRIARDIGRDLKQQLTYVPTQRRSREAHTSAKVRREPLLQTRRRTDILRRPTTRPQVNPRLIRQIRAGQATCSTSRRRKEPIPVLARRLSGIERCRRGRLVYRIEDGVHLEVIFGAVNVQIALVIAVRHDATVSPTKKQTRAGESDCPFLRSGPDRRSISGHRERLQSEGAGSVAGVAGTMELQ